LAEPEFRRRLEPLGRVSIISDAIQMGLLQKLRADLQCRAEQKFQRLHDLVEWFSNKGCGQFGETCCVFAEEAAEHPAALAPTSALAKALLENPTLVSPDGFIVSDLAGETWLIADYEADDSRNEAGAIRLLESLRR
jgi:hypothetical protein